VGLRSGQCSDRKEVVILAKSNGGKYRSAISGRYVTSAHGKRSPKTTVKESK
jgi:hypothetical protein